MRRKDLVVGNEYALYTGRMARFTLDGPSFAVSRTLEHVERVKVLDMKHKYNREISRHSTQTVAATGILIEDVVEEKERVLHTATALVMPWQEFEERSKVFLEAVEKLKIVKRERTAQAESLIKRARAVTVTCDWDGDESDPIFEVGKKQFENIIERLEKARDETTT